MQQPAAAPVGCYIHVPFCRSKCPYCDFYALRTGDAQQAAYAAAIARRLREAAAAGWRWSSVYIGGGTPSALELPALRQILEAARVSRSNPASEFTVECNPGDVTQELCALLAAQGVNRVSLGLQSAVEAERRALGRRSGAAQLRLAVERLHAAGVENISLDVMLGVPHQTQASLGETLAFCAELGAAHISAYLLKLEPGTPFARKPPPGLPEEDAQCELYLAACAWLAQNGYAQYEIANFCRPGRASAHNLLYWNAEPYFALGPGAHGFTGGRRWLYARDLDGFLAGAAPTQDGTGGDFAEYAMLRLRLTEGLREDLLLSRFGHGIPAAMRRAAESLEPHGLLRTEPGKITLTREGFLLSNRVIGALLGEVLNK